MGSEFTKQLGTRRRRAQKTPLVPPVQAGFYFEDGRSPLGVAMLSPEKCRDRAAECLQWAESAPSSRVRDILLDVARTWTRLAIEAEEWGQANRPKARLRSSARKCTEGVNAADPTSASRFEARAALAESWDRASEPVLAER